ncbi:ParB-like chromosome segregation protein Spo0J [Paraburkholderia sp. GAS82]
MQESGLKMPVVVDEKGGLIVGHGRLFAAHQLGFTYAPVLVTDGCLLARVFERRWYARR